jgi:cytochrome o ubiquinol oxidase subunit 2
MNTFFVPQLGSMIYTMNGMQTELWLQSDQPGTYRGISGHYSGEGFSDMHFGVKALPAEDFARWVNNTREGKTTLDAATYTELAKQSINIPAATYGTVERDLFKQIVSQQLAPGPGPALARAGISAKPEINP